jgi:deazaflavin-dependent oxidoreductase (nitroreductase family)
MAQLTYRHYRWQRILQRVPASAAGSALFSKFLHYVDRPLMRASGERISTPALLLGVPTVMLITTGAKSGQPRRTPVVGAPDGDNIILVASNWGKPRNPGWYYNLRANPTAQVEFDRHTDVYTAREVTDPDEYQRLWRKANEVYMGFDKYQQRAGGRRIPIMLLTPQEARRPSA